MNDSCDCCEGTGQLTPGATANRPGLNQLAYRVGTHAAFLETMKARLSNYFLDVHQEGLNAQGQPWSERIYPLSDLTARASEDPSIALLDAWATVGDVLTFYQERIANEGYLRTATERRSILELARLVGYALRPGVASTVYLAYTLDSNFKEEVVIPAGARVQSLPEGGELPQSFETSADLKARAAWNNLKPRVSKPQVITLENAQKVSHVYFKGSALNLKPNDPILFVFGDEVGEQVLRRVKESVPQFEENRTEVKLQEVPFLVRAAVIILKCAVAELEDQLGKLDPDADTDLLIKWAEQARERIENILLGNYPAIDAAYFSHERIYTFLEGLFRIARLPTSRLRDRSVVLFFSTLWQCISGTVVQGERDTTFQALQVQVVTGIIDRFLKSLQEAAFWRELVCLFATLIERTRPLTPEERRTIQLKLSRLAEQDLEGQLRKRWTELEETPEGIELRKRLIALFEMFKRLIRIAEVYDNIDNLLTDFLEILSDDPTEPAQRARERIQAVQAWLKKIPRELSISCGAEPTTITLDQLVEPLAKPSSLQPANSARLGRSLRTSFNQSASNIAELLIRLEPRLRETFYTAWSNARVNPPVSPLKSVHVFRLEPALFGYNALPEIVLNTSPEPGGTTLRAEAGPDQPQDERSNRMFLDAPYDAIQSGSYIVIRTQDQANNYSYLLARVNEVLVRPRTAYGISGKSTQLNLSREWWKLNENAMDTIRTTSVSAQSEPLSLAEEPYTTDVQGTGIELDAVYDGLESGRWLIVSGERTDIPGTNGVKASELVMLSAVEQSFDANLPGDATRTKITIANDLSYRYRRDTLRIYANVVKATHGETLNEVLGSGDGSQMLQSFTLRQAPLTYVAASNPSGVDSTLHVRVNEVEWHEAENLGWLHPTDLKFVTRTDDHDMTTVIFGNGQQGARLPTGVENVKATYRSGIGKAGNVKAGQISLLMTRPLGVKEVINPLRASGGADKEDRDQARKNAPLAVLALDRLVSTQDYADFARRFAGISKARAARLSDGNHQLVHVTIAGADDIPIDKNSDLYNNIVAALHEFGDPYLPIRVETRELILIIISANVRIMPDYLWESVAPKIRSSLLDTFSFERRELGQDVLLSEVISAIQSVEGVAYVDVDLLGGLSEKNDIGALRTPKEIAEEIQSMLAEQEKAPASRLPVNLAARNRAAQLAFLTPDVEATLILNEVKS